MMGLINWGQLARRSCFWLMSGMMVELERDENLADAWKDVIWSLIS